MNEFEQWLSKADEDLDTAQYNIDGNKLDAGVFFLQQAAEKALKALYIKNNKRLIRTHDLVVLSRELKAPENIQEFCKLLTPAYHYTRYPDIPRNENLKDEIRGLLKSSEEILKWVKKNI